MVIAMSALAQLDVDRLAKVLGRLGSDYDHEVVAAARAAEKLRKLSGMSWDEVLAAARAGRERHEQPQPSARRSGTEPDPYSWSFSTRPRDAAFSILASHRQDLQRRDIDFLRNLAIRSYDPTPRQLKWLNDIVGRLGLGVV